MFLYVNGICNVSISTGLSVIRCYMWSYEVVYCRFNVMFLYVNCICNVSILMGLTVIRCYMWSYEVVYCRSNVMFSLC